MKYKLILIFVILTLLVTPSIIALKTADFYYSPSCSHCQKVMPLIDILSKQYPIQWSFIDITKEQSDVKGVPLLIFDKGIKLSGSYEIPRYAKCYLEEQSNLNCITKSADTSTIDWFIRE